MKLAMPKTLIIFVSLFCFILPADAQKYVIHFNVIGGMFYYSGPGSSENGAVIFKSSPNAKVYAEDPYGSKPQFSYMLEFEAQKVTDLNLLYGVGFSYQQFNIKTNVDSILAIGVLTQRFAASGESKLNNTYLSLRPFIGKRFEINKFALDLTAGLDLAYCLNSKEKGEVTGETGNTFGYRSNRDKPALDIRPGIRAKLQTKKMGILLGYALGLSNYKNAYDKNAHSNYLYFGLSFSTQQNN